MLSLSAATSNGTLTKSLSSFSAPAPPFQFSSPSSCGLAFSLVSLCFTKRSRMNVTAQALSPLPDDRIIVGCGGASMDYLVMVDAFPKPDEKIRSSNFKVQGGGNVGNALTCAARLGLSPRIISKVADNSEGRSLIEEFEADGVDTSFAVVSKEGRSMFSYVIVDSETKTRTAIYHPGSPPMTPDDLPPSNLLSALDGAQLVYFDGLSLKTALAVAREASCKNIPILVDADMGEQGFEDLLYMADYAVCSGKYPQNWTKVPSMPSALVSMLLRLPKLKFVIVTLGEDGCIMLQRSQDAEDTVFKEIDVDRCLETLKQKTDPDLVRPTCVSSPVLKLIANGIGTMKGRLFVGTAERIPPSELVDTTGAGDAFIGSVLYALCANMPPEIMLPFAAQVAAGCCRALGARTGLPHRTDPRLECFLQQSSRTQVTP
ncbi:hypothetical protein Nepgr_004379 [Nepenthes gracilis]|uniref:Carbohydrate kinase PfkB domain-containing protein n=1 Tax=Nepenthes gracilis TaxID=150966 RepID=A0AAD3S179_NEPGR|nr:hypothetical protein Nepgr_004379 [Nepenthes gracilis]